MDISIVPYTISAVVLQAENSGSIFHSPLFLPALGAVSLLIAVMLIVFRSFMQRAQKWKRVAEDRTSEYRKVKLKMEKLSQDYEMALRELERISHTDSLTGLANRRGFDFHLEKEWRRGMRDGKPLSLAMVDIDFFKLYNDTYGRVRGDDLLREMGSIIKRFVFRPGDLACRFSGEEFLIILPHTDVEGALRVVERMTAKLEQMALPHPSSPVSNLVTVSVGIAAVIPDEDSLPEILLSEVDRAMYSAKHKGRNCVVCWPFN